MELVHEFTFNARLAPAVAVGEGPFGARRIREVLGGEVSGERISGKLGTGGSDWVLVGPDGWGRLDVRLTILTDDGAAIYVQYFGVIEYTEGALAANAGERSSEYEEHYFRTAPRLILYPLALLISFTIVHSLYWADMRMRTPLAPAIALLAARALSRPR